MVRDVDLISYLPQFIQEYQEIKQIMAAETPEVQILDDESEVIKNNQFIVSCDLNGIQRFEKILGIVPSAEDTLESRISRVLVRWNDVVPYTYRVLLQKLTTLCGSAFEVIPNFNEYELEIVTSLDLFGQVDELQNLIAYIMPANLVVTSKNELRYTLNGQTKIGSAFVGTAEVTLTETFNEN